MAAPELALVVGQEVVATCVVWHPRGHGFGFLAVPGVARQLFVSARNLVGLAELQPGDRVRCQIRMDARGRLEAGTVELLS